MSSFKTRYDEHQIELCASQPLIMRNLRFSFFVISVIGVVICDAGRHCPSCGKLTTSGLPDCTKHLDIGCERVRRPCSCCTTCARNIGETCSGRTPRCASGLMCVNGHGEALKTIPRNMRHYKGVCQNVEVCPVVVENLEVDDRRFGSDHDSSRV
uniref:Insulin-like growth factor binding protein n=2 Tax=Pinctada fucata TaxID=50426 RepID=A0A193CFV3_PINFU|nr:insulin-like growth factor binding protein [Pinctada fucata]